MYLVISGWRRDVDLITRGDNCIVPLYCNKFYTQCNVYITIRFKVMFDTSTLQKYTQWHTYYMWEEEARIL